jgi:nucleoid DNA-binding protein
MNEGNNLGGKRKIVKDVMAQGIPARKAAKAVSAAFDLMKQTLSFHEPVELPGIGTLEVVIHKGKSQRRLQKTRNIASKQIEHQVLTLPGRRRVVKLRPDPSLKLPLSASPTSSGTPTPAPKRLATPAGMPAIAHAYRGGAQPAGPYPSRTAHWSKS